MNSATPRNIVNGFLITGVWPYNRYIFTLDEYAPANIVTDSILDNTPKIIEYEETSIAVTKIDQPTSIISPESVRPYPKV